MAQPAASQPDPEEVIELEAWGQVSNKLVNDLVATQEVLLVKARICEQVVLCANETELRANVISQQSLAFHSLIARFADIVSMVAQSNDAVAELLAWKDILESHPLPHQTTSIAQKELKLQEAVGKPAVEQLEVERSRMEAARNDAQHDLDATLAGLDAGKREKKALEQQLDGLLLERNSCEQSIHALRVEQIEERQRLDTELKELRNQVFSEQELLTQLKNANNAAALAPASPYKSGVAAEDNDAMRRTEMSPQSADPRMNGGGASAERQMSPMVGGEARYSPRTPGQHEVAPSLNSGLKALQNVREQLREIRESHMSPTGAGGIGQRTYSYTADSTSPPLGGESPAAMQRANTSIGSGYGSATRGTLPSTSLASDDAASPWRQRLSKLQGDLRMLKSELGTSM